jgi:UDP-3-O-[3-hydroxymyristoyl] glucosamine N-acyltransferase
MHQTHTIREIAQAIGGELIGTADLPIMRVAHPADSIDASAIVLATDKKLLPLLTAVKPRAVIVHKDSGFDASSVEACILVSGGRLVMAKLTALFADKHPITPGTHPTAVIEPSAKIGKNAAIGAHVYIGAHAVIGDDATIYSGVRIGARVEIGERSIIHFNAAIGTDGFSFVSPSVENIKESGAVGATNADLVRIHSLGSVIIGDDVEIGANTSIDRGTIASTRIGNGTKIDNQVQIGHNVVIGKNCLICGRTGIAGSAVIGNRVVLGGGTGVADHVTVGDDVMAMGFSGIAGNIAPRQIIGGIPALPREKAYENHMNIGRIKGLIRKIDELTARLNELEEKEKKD